MPPRALLYLSVAVSRLELDDSLGCGRPLFDSGLSESQGRPECTNGELAGRSAPSTIRRFWNLFGRVAVTIGCLLNSCHGTRRQLRPQ